MRKKYTEDDYINKCNELNMIYIGYHKEKKLGTMVDFICPIHKSKGVQSKDWSHFKTYAYGCSYCSGRGKTTSEIQSEAKNKDVELISGYLGNEKPIRCKCRKCSNEWTTLPKVLITNGSGCPICGKEKAIKGETKSQEQFVFELKNVNPDIIVLGDYVNTHTKIKCKCNICGTIWYGYPANLLNSSAGCLGCNISNGEKKMLDTLLELNINYISQYTINGCAFTKKLRFDAFDVNNNIAFEFNGEQHYRPVDFAGRGKEWALEEYNITKQRDKIKYDFCILNGIKLVVIPYWEKENMKDFIIKKLKELNKKTA